MRSKGEAVDALSAGKQALLGLLGLLEGGCSKVTFKLMTFKRVAVMYDRTERGGEVAKANCHGPRSTAAPCPSVVGAAVFSLLVLTPFTCLLPLLFRFTCSKGHSPSRRLFYPADFTSFNSLSSPPNRRLRNSQSCRRVLPQSLSRDPPFLTSLNTCATVLLTSTYTTVARSLPPPQLTTWTTRLGKSNLSLSASSSASPLSPSTWQKSLLLPWLALGPWHPGPTETRLRTAPTRLPPPLVPPPSPRRPARPSPSRRPALSPLPLRPKDSPSPLLALLPSRRPSKRVPCPLLQSRQLRSSHRRSRLRTTGALQTSPSSSSSPTATRPTPPTRRQPAPRRTTITRSLPPFSPRRASPSPLVFASPRPMDSPTRPSAACTSESQACAKPSTAKARSRASA